MGEHLEPDRPENPDDAGRPSARELLARAWDDVAQASQAAAGSDDAPEKPSGELSDDPDLADPDVADQSSAPSHADTESAEAVQHDDGQPGAPASAESSTAPEWSNAPGEACSASGTLEPPDSPSAAAVESAEDSPAADLTLGETVVLDADEDDDEPGDAVLPQHPAAGRSEPVELSAAAVIEALLFSTDSPLPLQKLAELASAEKAAVKDAIEQLNQRYRDANAAFRIEQLAGGYQMLTLPHFDEHVSQLRASRQESRLSAGALETLAIVAYKQPVTRATLESIRGVACGEVLRALMDRNLVKMVGRAEELGRPMLYGTTKKFLRIFNLPSLKDLPQPKSAKKQDA